MLFLGMFGIVFELVFSENKNKNEDSVLQLVYFEFKYTSGIFGYILYFKNEKNNICLVDSIQ